MVAERELQRAEIHKVSDSHKKIDSTLVILEDEVLLILNGKNYRSLYCVPAYLEELMRGYLVSQGICGPSDIEGIEVRSDGGKYVVEARAHGHGIEPREIGSEVKISIADVRNAVDILYKRSILHEKTNGTHTVEIFSGSSSVFAEDISRHCTIDKAIGLALQNGIDLTTCTMVTSCRQTESSITKAIYSQIPIVASIAAVTTLAIESARKYGITLVGFARERNFFIYSHQERIVENG